MNLKILHLNVERSKHYDLVFNLLKEHKPDIACFAEMIEKDARKFATQFGYELAFAPLVLIKGENTEDTQGSAILSQKSIKEVKIYRYGDNSSIELPVYIENQNRVKKRGKDRWTHHHSLLNVKVLAGDKNVTISTTHFPVTDHSLPIFPSHTLPDLDYINDVLHARDYFDRLVRIIRNTPGPVIFTSDLNNARGEYVYDTLAHELIDHVPLSLTSTIDPFLHRIPDLQLVVDTIMTSPDVSVKDFKILEGFSDHKALMGIFEV